MIESKNVKTIYSVQNERTTNKGLGSNKKSNQNFMEDSHDNTNLEPRINFKILSKERRESPGFSGKGDNTVQRIIRKIKIPSGSKKIQKILNYSMESEEDEDVCVRTSRSFDFSKKFSEILKKNLDSGFKAKGKKKLNRTQEDGRTRNRSTSKKKIMKSCLRMEENEKNQQQFKKFSQLLHNLNNQAIQDNRNLDDTVQICTLNTSLVDTAHDQKTINSNKLILKPNDKTLENSKIRVNNPLSKNPFSDKNFVYNSPLRVDKTNKEVDKNKILLKNGGALFSFNQKNSLNVNNSLKKASQTGNLGSFLEDLDGEIENINKKIHTIVNYIEYSEKKSSQKKVKKGFVTPKKPEQVVKESYMSSFKGRKLSYGFNSKSQKRSFNEPDKDISTIEVNLKDFMKDFGTLKKQKKTKKKLKMRRKRSTPNSKANAINPEPKSLKITPFATPEPLIKRKLNLSRTRKKSYNQMYINKIYENSKVMVKIKDTQKKLLDQKRKEFELRKCTFKPNLNNKSLYKPKRGFFDRLKTWVEKKEKKKKILEKTIEIDRNRECSFKPDLSKGSSNKKSKNSKAPKSKM